MTYISYVYHVDLKLTLEMSEFGGLEVLAAL